MSPPPCWELREGATVLATLHAVDDDWPWVLCNWRPSATFEPLRGAFDAFSLAAPLLQTEEGRAQWDDIRRQIWSLKLTLHPDHESSSTLPPLGHVLLYLAADGTAKFRISSTPNVRNSTLVGARAIGARVRLALRRLKFAIQDFLTPTRRPPRPAS